MRQLGWPEQGVAVAASFLEPRTTQLAVHNATCGRAWHAKQLRKRQKGLAPVSSPASETSLEGLAVSAAVKSRHAQSRNDVNGTELAGPATPPTAGGKGARRETRDRRTDCDEVAAASHSSHGRRTPHAAANAAADAVAVASATAANVNADDSAAVPMGSGAEGAASAPLGAALPVAPQGVSVAPQSQAGVAALAQGAWALLHDARHGPGMLAPALARALVAAAEPGAVVRWPTACRACVSVGVNLPPPPEFLFGCFPAALSMACACMRLCLL
jgi:hypothetical protein